MNKFTRKHFTILLFAFAILCSAKGFAQINWNFGVIGNLSAYPSSGIPANITVDSITKGNSFGTAALLSTSSISSGYTGASGGGNAGVPARTGALDYTVNATTGSAYFEIKLTPAAGYYVNVTNISFGSRSTATGPKKYSIRTSLDGFATEAAGDTINSVAGVWGLRTKALSVTGTVGNPVTIRIYGYAGTGSASSGTVNFRIDDVALSATAIGAPLMADFAANNVCFADSVRFTDMSTGPNTIVSWTWDFGDGSLISNDTNPVHYYTAAGTYTVTLNVIDNMAGTDSYTGSVTVHSKPVSKFSAPLSVCGSLPVQLYDSSTVANSTINSLSYNFGDVTSGANNTSTLQDPTHVFSSTGSYTLTQIATSAFGCKDTSSRTINVNAIPVAGFYSAGPACSGTSAQFNDTSSIASGSISNYHWNFADPASGVNDTSTTQDPMHTFNTAGSYMVTQIVKSSLGCADTVTGLFIVNPTVTPSVTISGPTTACEGDSIVGIAHGVNGGANPGYVWYLAGAGPPTPIGTDSVLVIPAGLTTPGTYTVTVELTSDATCASTSTVTSNPYTVDVYAFPAPPVITATGSTLSTTVPYTSYQWYFEGATLGTSATQTATADGDYTVVGFNANGCGTESATFTYTATGIINYSSNINVNVFPNPSSNGVFTYTLSDAKAVVTVYNIVGKQISNTEVLKGTHTIDLSAEANGSYFLSIKTDKSVVTKKLIVNK